MRIVASDSNWRMRKNVVACASCGRSWGLIMKENVKASKICERSCSHFLEAGSILDYYVFAFLLSCYVLV